MNKFLIIWNLICTGAFVILGLALFNGGSLGFGTLDFVFAGVTLWLGMHRLNQLESGDKD